MDLQEKATRKHNFKAEQDAIKEQARLDFEYDRLAQQDQQSDERLEVAREKMNKK